MKLLIIEDEEGIALPLKKALEKKGFAVTWQEDGEEGLSDAMTNQYDCIILDLNLPSIDGLEITKTLRNEKNTIPILMLTARTAQNNKIEGFVSGTDDYLIKPFDFLELLYRIESLIRRNSLNKTEKISIYGLEIDLLSHKVKKDNLEIKLNNKEFGILEYLIRNKGKIVSTTELLEHVWDNEIDSFSDTVKTNIKTLRKALDQKKEIIKTVKGQGYIIE